jgi:hypothetical protein
MTRTAAVMTSFSLDAAVMDGPRWLTRRGPDLK